MLLVCISHYLFAHQNLVCVTHYLILYWWAKHTSLFTVYSDKMNGVHVCMYVYVLPLRSYNSTQEQVRQLEDMLPKDSLSS